MADATHIEPITPTYVTEIIERTPGCPFADDGRTDGPKLCLDLADQGVLETFGVEMIAARPEVIRKAENAFCFVKRWRGIGLSSPVHVLRSR